jgi:hypothetical protein
MPTIRTILPAGAAICIAATTSGCVNNTAVLAGYAPPARTTTLEIVDSRPAEERLPKTKTLSLLITACNYGVDQVGEKDIVPDRLTLMKDSLAQQLGGSIDGKKLVISRYGVHINRAHALRNSTYGGDTGLVAAVMRGMGANCPREKMKAGWYEPNDITTPYSPIIVEINADLDGVAYTVRSVYSPDSEYWALGKPEAAPSLFAALDKAHQALAIELKSKLPRG